MYAMRWLIMSAVWTASVSSVWTASAAAVELRCDHPLCVDVTVNKSRLLPGDSDFRVEGRLIKIIHWQLEKKIILSIDCLRWAALDSAAMPRFSTEYVTSFVELVSCPPPTRPLLETLAALNVTILQTDMTTVSMYQLPVAPALAEPHFTGLELISWLSLSYNKPTDVKHILGVFKNLRGLNLGRARISATELSRFRSTLRALILKNTAVRPLSEMLRDLPYLQNLTLTNVEIETYVTANTEDNTVKSVPSALEILLLDGWKERHMMPMKHCENLRYLKLKKPKVEELPSRWVAACPSLEEVIVSKATHLATLPARLLESATGLKVLNMTDGALESLPDGLLDGTPNLLVLNLSKNRLRTITSDTFLGPALRYLSLSYNLIENGALDAVSPLTSLTELDLGYNPSLNDLCDQNGYSTLRHLTQLRQLSLAASTVTRVCRDWRESMLALTQLDLRGTEVNTTTVLEFAGQTRGVALNEANVLVGPAPDILLYDLWKKQGLLGY